MGRARLGTLCTCLLRMPAILSSRTKFKRPLNAEAEQPHSRSILPPPVVGSTLLRHSYTSERGRAAQESTRWEEGRREQQWGWFRRASGDDYQERGQGGQKEGGKGFSGSTGGHAEGL
jgi:hypothetical protein